MGLLRYSTVRAERFSEPRELILMEPNWEAIRDPDPEGIQATWIGHSTFLVQVDGINFLTDPIFSLRCSPTQLIGPKRIVPTPCSPQDLPQIDFVLLSHNHYDHLDYNSVRQLEKKVRHWFVPFGVRKWFVSIGMENVTELNWWESSYFPCEDASSKNEEMEDTFAKVSCTPCQHFSGRTFWDRDESVWATWVLETPRGKKLFFSGDTGLVQRREGIECDNEIFQEIGRRLGPMDLSLIPIGAYDPQIIMSKVHVNPEEAVRIHEYVESKQSIGMHWGTFRLTQEPVLEPPQRLRAELSRKHMDLDCFISMAHGETRVFKK